jgi:hypothetical protein
MKNSFVDLAERITSSKTPDSTEHLSIISALDDDYLGLLQGEDVLRNKYFWTVLSKLAKNFRIAPRIHSKIRITISIHLISY